MSSRDEISIRRVLHKAKSAAATIDAWYNKGNDHDGSYYFHGTKPGESLPLYADRAGLVVYVMKESPKLRMLGYMAHLICIVHRGRLLVLTDWPLTQWNVELMLYLLRFIVLGI